MINKKELDERSDLLIKLNKNEKLTIGGDYENDQQKRSVDKINCIVAKMCRNVRKRTTKKKHKKKNCPRYQYVFIISYSGIVLLKVHCYSLKSR